MDVTFFGPEAKGGAGRLAEGQMSKSWIRSRAKKLAQDSGNPEVQELLEAIRAGKVKGMLVNTKIDGDIVHAPSFEIKDWAEIDPNSWQ